MAGSSGVSTRPTDEIYSRILYDYEDVPATFLVAGKVPVPAGRYHWFNVNPYVRTAEFRKVYLKGEIICCSFYDGKFLRVDLL